jgi:hypothetical protein
MGFTVRSFTLSSRETPEIVPEAATTFLYQSAVLIAK